VATSSLGFPLITEVSSVPVALRGFKYLAAIHAKLSFIGSLLQMAVMFYDCVHVARPLFRRLRYLIDKSLNKFRIVRHYTNRCNCIKKNSSEAAET
jgi:hypothetical protein